MIEKVKVIFFLLGSIFAQENCRIASADTRVTVDVPQKTISIMQENLFTTLENEANYKYTQKQFYEIVKQPKLSKELGNFTLESLDFLKDGKKLHAMIKLRFKSAEDLRYMGLYLSKQKDSLAHVNVKEWKISSEEGTLNDKYWFFDMAKPFTFSFDLNDKMQRKYDDKVSGLLPVYEAIMAWKEE